MACSMIAARSAFVAGASLKQRTNSTAKVSVRAPARKVACVKASASSSQVPAEISRREAIGTSAAAAIAAIYATPALAGNIPSGFSAISDSNKNYAFLIPFGWQEVAVDGAVTVYKDVIEPLESVSLTVLPTQTKALSDIGSPEKVAQALLDNVLATPAQNPKLISASAREVEGNTYYTFEYTAQGRGYSRHSVASVSIRDGQFFTLTTGANERRWGKMEKKINVVAKSFYNLY